MVGGLLWGCSLFLFGFFPRFLRFFFGKDVRFPWSSWLFGLAYLVSCCGQPVGNFPGLDLTLGMDYYKHIGFNGPSFFLMLFVLAILSWLFWLATMVLGFYGNDCPDIRGCCGSADADCGRPHRAYDGGSFYDVSRIVLSSWLRLFLAFSFSLFWAPMLVFSWVSYLRL